MKIKGEYEVNILLQNMFGSYLFTEKNHNIVTDEGLSLILEMISGKTTERLGHVHVGKNSAEASPLDTYNNSLTPLTNDDIIVEGNTLSYVIECDGSDIDTTCEIGICSDGNNKTLITRDVHDTYDVPRSAIITIKYSLTLTNKEEEEEIIEEPVEEEEESND